MNVTLTATLSTLNREDDRSAELWISSPSIKDAANDVLHPGGLRKVPFRDGRLSVELLSTATVGTDPTGWAYTFEVKGSGWSLPRFTTVLPSDADLADLQPMDPAGTDPLYLNSVGDGWILSWDGLEPDARVGTFWIDMTDPNRKLWRIAS